MDHEHNRTIRRPSASAIRVISRITDAVNEEPVAEDRIFELPVGR
jgi:hypothetical protein